jgi:polar amino acid transport system substrate-binding protein
MASKFCLAIGPLLIGWLACAGPATALPVCPAKPIKAALYEVGLYYKKGVGLDQDVVDELQRRSGCVFQVVVMPRARIFKEMEAGRIDVTTSVLETPERDKSMWIANYIQLRYYAIVGAGVPADVHTMDDFLKSPTKLQWSVVRSFAYGPYFDPLLKKLAGTGRVHEVTDSALSYKMLAANRIAGTLATPMVYHGDLAEHGLTDKVRVEIWDAHMKPIPRGVGFSRQVFSQEQADEWARIVDAMNRDGTMKKLIAKYLPPQEAADAVMKP